MDETKLENITDALLRSYDLDQSKRSKLPSKEAIIDVVNDVRRILFRVTTPTRSYQWPVGDIT